MKHWLFALAILLANQQAIASGEVYLQLQPRLQADHTDLALKDIASIVSDGEDLWTKQVFFKLASLSQPIRLSQMEVEQALLKQFAWMRGKIVWGGPSSILIEGRKHLQSLDNGVLQAQQWLEQTMESQAGRKVEYHLVSKLGPLELPMGVVSQQVMTGQVRFIGNRAELPLYVFVDQHLIAKRNLQFLLRQSNDIKEQPAGLAADKDIISAKTEPAASGRALALPASSNLAISKNQLVKVLMQYGPIQIESAGRAQSDAVNGASVMVQRLDSQDFFMAQVLQPGVVTVKE